MRVAVVPGPGQSGIICPLPGDEAGPGASSSPAAPLAAAGLAALSGAAFGAVCGTDPPATNRPGTDPSGSGRPGADWPGTDPPGAEPGAARPGTDSAGVLPNGGRFVANLAAAMRDAERGGDVRWVWPATADLYPVLLRAGIRVGRCHDLALTEGLLLGRDGRGSESAFLAAAAARLRGQPVPAGPARPAAKAGPQPSLFDSAEQSGPTEAEMAATLADVIAVHSNQLARIAADEHPARFGLLAAAESAGALAAAEMTQAGLPWRPDEHDRLLTGLLGQRPAAVASGGQPAVPARLAELAAQITAALHAVGPVNPDSPAQLARALAAEGISVSSTRFAVLREIDHPAIPLLLEYKELSRLHAAYGWSWLDTWVTGGRFRPEYVVGGVVSGRWASRGGGALQIPKVLRRAAVADPGWVLVVADAAQLEPRVLAALAGDAAFADAAASGDLYTALASAFGGDRALAKVALLSAMYGGSGGDAGQLLTVLRRRFPRALAFVESAARAGEEGRVVRSVLGRTCPPPSAAWRTVTESVADAADPDAGRPLRAGQAARARGRFTRNFVVQASAADWALVLLASLRRHLAAMSPAPPQPGTRPEAAHGASPGSGKPELVFFQHDEVIVHCPAGVAGQVAAAVTKAAAEAARLLFGATRVSFPMTTAIVTSYADAK